MLGKDKDVLGKDNDDVINFRIQLNSLKGISKECQQLGREGVSRLNEIKVLDEVFNAQSEQVSELVEKIQKEPGMKGGLGRADDSGIDSGPDSPGL